MSADVASRNSLGFGDQPIYISSATLVLKSSTLQPIDDYVWHTEVKTPTPTATEPTPPAPPSETEIRRTEATTQAAAPATPAAKPVTTKSHHLFMPSITYDESDDITTVLGKFMACERYHTVYNQHMNQTLAKGC